MIGRGQRDPNWFIEHVLGDRAWGKQREIAESVRDNARTAVPSCHASGKSWCAARIALWFLYCFPDSIVATTAPTFRQVQKITWQEIRKAYTGARYPLGGTLLQTEIKVDDGWFAFGFSTDDPNAFQGLHSATGYVLVILDESAGVSPEIWQASDGVLAGQHSRLLSIGNPTEASGPFFNECRAKGTTVISISAYDTPNVQAGGDVKIPGLVTAEWVKDKEERWGVTSPLFVSRVKGEFPDAGADAVFPLAMIRAAQARELEPSAPHLLGADLGAGGDETVVVERHGPVLKIIHTSQYSNTMETVGVLGRLLDETEAAGLNLDNCGLGLPLLHRLRELQQSGELGDHASGAGIEGVNVGLPAYDNELYTNRRAELCWSLRERLEQGEVQLPDDEELVNQMTSIRWGPDSRGRIKIESKEDMKKRGVPSPDRLDAIIIALAGEPYTDEHFRSAFRRTA